jgi:hypothetical protein
LAEAPTSTLCGWRESFHDLLLPVYLAFFCPGLYMAIQESHFRAHAVAYRGFLADEDSFHKMRSHNHPPVLVRYVRPDGVGDSTFVEQHYNGQTAASPSS